MAEECIMRQLSLQLAYLTWKVDIYKSLQCESSKFMTETDNFALIGKPLNSPITEILPSDNINMRAKSERRMRWNKSKNKKLQAKVLQWLLKPEQGVILMWNPTVKQVAVYKENGEVSLHMQCDIFAFISYSRFIYTTVVSLSLSLRRSVSDCSFLTIVWFFVILIPLLWFPVCWVYPDQWPFYMNSRCLFR